MKKQKKKTKKTKKTGKVLKQKRSGLNDWKSYCYPFIAKFFEAMALNYMFLKLPFKLPVLKLFL